MLECIPKQVAKEKKYIEGKLSSMSENMFIMTLFQINTLAVYRLLD